MRMTRWPFLLLAAWIAAPAYASEQSSPLEGIYTIQQKANGRYVDAWADKGHDYGLVTRDRRQPDGSQDWVLKHLGGNRYTIQQALTGRYVDAWGDKAHDHGLVTRDQRQTDGSQDWLLVPVGSNEYTIQQKLTNRYVDAWTDKGHDYRLVTRDRQIDASQGWVLTATTCYNQKRLDYVYVRPSGANLELVPTKAEVLREWTYHDPAPGCNNLETDLSDHYPLKVTFSVKGAACAITELTVLTYNTHLFYSLRDTIAAAVKTHVLIYQDLIRRPLIAERVRASGADIVGLQEVWGPESMHFFAEELKDVYPYSYFVTDRLRLDHPLRNSSGLVLLSKLPMSAKLREFPVKHGFFDDGFATKGVVSADLELCVPSAEPRSATALEGIYTIRQKLNDRYVDAWGDTGHDYRLVTRDQRQTDGSQDWVLKHLGGNEYAIQQRLTGRYVDAWADKGHDYGLVTRDKSKRQTDGSQNWLLTHLGGNEYRIQQKQTGRYVDAFVDAGADYGLVTRDQRQTDGSQDWVFRSVGPTIRLGVSHALTGDGRDNRAKGRDYLYDVEMIIEETIRNDSPAIIMGDFNVHGGYRDMNGLFTAAGAVDAYRAVHPWEPPDAQTDDPDAQTTDRCRNTLVEVFDVKGKVDAREGVAAGKVCLAADR